MAPRILPRGVFHAELAAVVNDCLDSTDPLEILEAGCGRMWTWDLGERPIRVTGVDCDAEALRLRTEERGDLNQAIVGDLRTVDLPHQSFDLVYSAYVLEHVAGAALVLDKMIDAVRPGGLLVIKIPDRDSVYAFLTRRTPHWAHVRYKWWIRRKPLAGTPGHGPHPVFYDPIVSRRGLLEWAASRRLPVVAMLADNSHLRFFGRAAGLVDAVLHAIALLSFGRLTADWSNVGVVLRTPHENLAAAQP